MRFLITACLATLTALALMLASPVNAHTRPKPKPPMDCFVVEDAFVECRVRK